MITRIKGRLLKVGENRCELACGFLHYEVMVPGCVQERLTKELGKRIELYVHHYFEGSMTGNAAPRLIGFTSEREREFFLNFIKVPKVGEKLAVRALVAPVARVAQAIESGNRFALSELPGIGPRTAEKIIAELKGKMTPFMGADVLEPEFKEGTLSELEEEARSVLIQLGYRPAEAERLVRKVGASHPDLGSSEELLRIVFQEGGAKHRVEVNL